MTSGIRTTNLPLGKVIEVIGHADAGGGARTMARMSLTMLVAAIRDLVTQDPSGIGMLIQQVIDLQNATTALQGNINAEHDDRVENVTRLIAQQQADNKARRDDIEAVQGNLNREHDERVNADTGLRQNQAALGRELDGFADALELIRRSLSGLAARKADTSAVVSALLAADQPGIAPLAFAGGMVGPFDERPPLDPSDCVRTALGPAYRIGGAGLVAPRMPMSVDPDAIRVLRLRYWRLEDVLDPNNSAVDIGIQWLGKRDEDLGRALLHRDSNLAVQDGPRTLVFRVPGLADELPRLAPPRGAVSWLPYLRAWGADGATAVGQLGVYDATFAGVYAPDVLDLAARLGQIEGQIAAGLPLSAPILPSYAVADLPAPGNRGRQAWARDGRAPNAAGQLEAANAGTGVKVDDNGVRWVISGTNQAVQA